MTTYQTHLKSLDDYLILKNFSVATRKSYSCALKQFFKYHEVHNWSFPYTQEMAKEYILYRYKQGKKWQTVNGDYSAICKLYAYVLDLEWNIKKLPRPRKERTLPELISKEEVAKLIASASSLKHQALIILFYATGMRLGEVLNLKLTDIDSDRLQIRVRKGKGAKDRLVSIPLRLIEILREYYKVYRPYIYLFNSRQAGKPLSRRTAQWTVKKARKMAGIQREVSPHVLRHSYATHHLECGTDLLYLQKMLGHKNIKTTCKYIRLCQHRYHQVKHPIVDMDIQLKIPEI